jgi:hypothetical protein
MDEAGSKTREQQLDEEAIKFVEFLDGFEKRIDQYRREIRASHPHMRADSAVLRQLQKSIATNNKMRDGIAQLIENIASVSPQPTAPIVKALEDILKGF